METLISLCMDHFLNVDTPLSLTEAMMDLESSPMHSPVHHFIVPAALLTVAFRRGGRSASDLERALHLAKERSGKVPGGICGYWGCCGAAVGAGVFASLWLGADPKKEDGWAQANRFTSKCLEHVASVGGPRCCKRVTYLCLEAAHMNSSELLGVNLGEFSRPVCHRSALNSECSGVKCPFYPTMYS